MLLPMYGFHRMYRPWQFCTSHALLSVPSDDLHSAVTSRRFPTPLYPILCSPPLSTSLPNSPQNPQLLQRTAQFEAYTRDGYYHASGLGRRSMLGAPTNLPTSCPGSPIETLRGATSTRHLHAGSRDEDTPSLPCPIFCVEAR